MRALILVEKPPRERPSALRKTLASGGRVATPSDVPPGPGPGAVAVPDGLAPRELEVLTHIAQGQSNTEVAAALFVSEATVKTHVNHLLARTGMRDRAPAGRLRVPAGLAAP